MKGGFRKTPHSELLKLGGLYATHYERQFSVSPVVSEEHVVAATAS